MCAERSAGRRVARAFSRAALRKGASNQMAESAHAGLNCTSAGRLYQHVRLCLVAEMLGHLGAAPPTNLPALRSYDGLHRASQLRVIRSNDRLQDFRGVVETLRHLFVCQHAPRTLRQVAEHYGTHSLACQPNHLRVYSKEHTPNLRGGGSRAARRSGNGMRQGDEATKRKCCQMVRRDTLEIRGGS